MWTSLNIIPFYGTGQRRSIDSWQEGVSLTIGVRVFRFRDCWKWVNYIRVCGLTEETHEPPRATNYLALLEEVVWVG